MGRKVKVVPFLCVLSVFVRKVNGRLLSWASMNWTAYTEKKGVIEGTELSYKLRPKRIILEFYLQDIHCIHRMCRCNEAVPLYSYRESCLGYDS